MGAVGSTTGALLLRGGGDAPVFLFRKDAQCTKELALVTRVCVQLLLKLEPTSPSSLNSVKKRKQYRSEMRDERYE